LGVEKDEGFYFFYTLFWDFYFIISEAFFIIFCSCVYVVTGAKGYTLVASDCGIVVRYRYGAIIIIVGSTIEAVVTSRLELLDVDE